MTRVSQLPERLPITEPCTCDLCQQHRMLPGSAVRYGYPLSGSSGYPFSFEVKPEKTTPGRLSWAWWRSGSRRARGFPSACAAHRDALAAVTALLAPKTRP